MAPRDSSSGPSFTNKKGLTMNKYLIILLGIFIFPHIAFSVETESANSGVNVGSSVENSIQVSGSTFNFPSGNDKNVFIQVTPPITDLDAIQPPPIFSPSEHWTVYIDTSVVMPGQLYSQDILANKLGPLLDKGLVSLQVSVDMRTTPIVGAPIHLVIRQPLNSVKIGTIVIMGLPNMMSEELMKLALSIELPVVGSNYVKVEMRNGIVSKGSSNGAGGNIGTGAPIDMISANGGAMIQDNVAASEAFFRPYVKVTLYSNNFFDPSSFVGFTENVSSAGNSNSFEVFFPENPVKFSDEQIAIIQKAIKEISLRWGKNTAVEIVGVSLTKKELGETNEITQKVRSEIQKSLSDVGISTEDLLNRTSTKIILSPNEAVGRLIKLNKATVCVIIKVRYP